MGIHTCTVCGLTAAWSDSWAWYGSWNDWDEGTIPVKACSEACMGAAIEAGLCTSTSTKRKAIRDEVLQKRREQRLDEKQAREMTEWKRLQAKYGHHEARTGTANAVDAAANHQANGEAT